MFEHHEIPLVEEIDSHAPKRATPERDLQRTALHWLRIVLPPGSMVAAVPNEQRGLGRTQAQRMRYGAARKLSGVVSGWPDLMACLPGGKLVFVEMKVPGGVLSANQQGVHGALRSIEHTVIVADGLESLRSGLRRAGVPLREATGQPEREAHVRKARTLARDAIPFVLALMLAMPALAAPPVPGSEDAEIMAPHADWITRQRSPSGMLCCSIADGRPAEVRELTPGHFEVFYSREHWEGAPKPGVWLAVPPETILPQQSPMFMPIVWILFGRVRCLALAGAS